MTHSFVFIILWLFCMCQVLLYRINRNTLHIPPFSTNEKRLFYHRHSNSWQYTKQPLKLCEYFFITNRQAQSGIRSKSAVMFDFFCCVGFDSLFLVKTGEKHPRFYIKIFRFLNVKKARKYGLFQVNIHLVSPIWCGWQDLNLHGVANRT